jgi:hypothetical protein
MTPHPGDQTATHLATALVNGCAQFGLDWGEEAAIQLLIAHGTWLRRPEFQSHVTLTAQPGAAAWADWTGIATEPDVSPASSSERAILRLACHLAGHLPDQADTEWSLAAILSPLDTANTLLASRAVAMAALGPATIGPLQ